LNTTQKLGLTCILTKIKIEIKNPKEKSWWT